MKTLLLVGGGHSHIEVVRRFAAKPVKDVRLVLINPTRHTPYSGMLPGLIAGHYDFDQCHIDLLALAGRANCEFVESEVTAIDAAANTASCASGETLVYDVASIDVGSTPPTFGIKGVEEHAIRIKPTPYFLAKWEHTLQRAADGDLPEGFRIVVVGGGAAGVEVLLAMQHRLQSTQRQRVEYALITESHVILPAHGKKVRATFADVLRTRGISTHCGQRVAEVTGTAIVTDSGISIPADLMIWATGAGAASWPGRSGLAVNQQGFLRVSDTLQVIDQPNLFAAGDIATMEGQPRPKSGVYAVRQGPPLADNLRRALSGMPTRAYRPQRLALALISTGDRYAVASRGWLFARGRWVWRWKDHIDRSFMLRYR